jgi:hypothetical protein
VVALAVVSGALLVVRLVAASRIGFGDSEALYAAYALHLHPAYLDHPGLIAAFARAIGGGTAPSPQRAHIVTSALSTFVPWAMALSCRASGASWERSFGGALVFALVPEIAVGLFAMTPDLLLALAWIGAMGFGAYALRSTAGGGRAACGFAASGVLAGLAAASKATGVTLMAGLAVAYVSRSARAHARTIAPWAGLATGALIASPVAAFEARRGWPMLLHRFVSTQGAAGLSLRNAAVFAGGQLAYLSPLMAALAVLAARQLWRGRTDVTGRMLIACCIVPLAALLPFCLWSRVAEPHWLAPALLALVPAASRAREQAPRWLGLSACSLAAAMVIVTHAWVLIPALLRFAPASYDARFDLANELYGWPDAARAVRDEARRASTHVSVVGPHWVICAQLEAALRGELRVGCNTPIRDDFDDWLPRDLWRQSDTILWVTDGRFGPPPEFPSHAVQRMRAIPVERGGRAVRVFTLATMSKHGG